VVTSEFKDGVARDSEAFRSTTREVIGVTGLIGDRNAGVGILRSN